MADQVVITGLGIVSPIGIGEQAFWESLRTGRSGADVVDGLDVADLPRKIACQVREPIDDFKAAREGGDRTGRAARLASTAARQATASAGLDVSALGAGRSLIVVGTTMGETEFIEERLFESQNDWLTHDHMAKIIGGRPGSIARRVQESIGTQGAAIDLYGACAAGNMAVATSRRRLLDGDCDIALAGGSDGFSRLAFLGFMRLRVMAAAVCRPFDVDRDGLFVGEGAAMFVLERESDARARGARVRARVAGAAITCENYHPTRPQPDGDGLTRATIGALADASLEASSVEYVCAHGTGTPQNDAIEVKVMERCFPSGVAFSSIKALTGHTMGAAAAIELACCVLSIEQGQLIPTWHLDKVLEPCSLDPIQHTVRTTAVTTALNNSAGFGGYNASVVLTAP